VPRDVSWGTPRRTDRYVRLRGPHFLLYPSLGAGAALGLLLAAAHFLGFRGPLSPGPVSSKHAIYGERCDECHVPLQGVADVRCQRCHDPSSAGRLTHPAHVFFGSLDAARSAAAPSVACARCHVEHRGAAVVLSRVDEGHCTDCHADPSQFEVAFDRFEDHVEFDALAQEQRQDTGIVFSHRSHVAGENGKPGFVLRDRRLQSTSQTCGECHRLDNRGDDFVPLTFEAHCADCHSGDLRMDPVASRQVETIADIELALPPEVIREWGMRESDFDAFGGSVERLEPAHRDPWILHNLRKLWRELDPAGFAADRAQLQARQTRLQRRLDLASPTALEGEQRLSQRASTLESELEYIEERLAAQPAARAPAGGVSRLTTVLEAMRASGDPAAGARAAELLERGARLGTEPIPELPLPPAAFEERRSELLRILDALEATAPDRSAQVEELRRRLEQLSPGETSEGVLKRTRQQRLDTLRRVRDEIRLRESGTAPPSEMLLDAERQAVTSSLREVGRALQLLDAVPDPRAMLSPRAQEEKRLAVQNLTRGCGYCHEVSPDGRMADASAADAVLWRARFTHRDHLTQGEVCTHCHADGNAPEPWSIETSGESSELNFKGVNSCRECHRPGQADDGCQKCHDYHPPAVP
jgi:hypothetical protein